MKLQGIGFFWVVCAFAACVSRAAAARNGPAGTPVPPTVFETEDWRAAPLFPTEISATMKELYRAGIENGNDPARFSKFGDSNSIHTYFLGCFDSGADAYDLGAYPILARTVERYQGSFARSSQAARNGLVAGDLIGPGWDGDGECLEDESAAACELRLWRPSIVLIAVGTNDVYRGLPAFETSLRAVVRAVIDAGAVPVLFTKADDLNQDDGFNRAIARIAAEFEAPLVNLWKVFRPLPNHGLRGDNAHPSASSPRFCDFVADELRAYGWPVRNLTALAALDLATRLLNQR